MIEVNTIVRIPPDVDVQSLKQGKVLMITLDRERVLPLRIAVLFFHTDWNFLGYCRVLSIKQHEGKTELEVEILTVFSEAERTLYKAKFVEAGKFTGEA